jgi:hypothetical protein
MDYEIRNDEEDKHCLWVIEYDDFFIIFYLCFFRLGIFLDVLFI